MPTVDKVEAYLWPAGVTALARRQGIRGKWAVYAAEFETNLCSLIGRAELKAENHATEKF